MAYKNLSEKRVSLRSETSRSDNSWSKTPGCVAIVVSQHLLLWSAVYVAASSFYILGVEAVTQSDIPSVALLLVASIVSLSYVCLQNATTRLRRNARDRMQSEKVDTFQNLATRTLEGLTFIWGLAVMLSIVFTTARQPLCSGSSETDGSAVSSLDRGTTCAIDRIGLVMSWVALIACGALFILLHKVNNPFRCHLLGFIREDDLLPLFLPHRTWHDRQLFSNMTSKYRSSASLSSLTIAARWSESASNLLPANDGKPHGLGIYGTNRSTPSLLRPRPSLSSIRSQVTMSMPPAPTTPLPPLSAYFPAKHRTQSAMHKAVHPPPKSPARAYAVRPNASHTSVRVVSPPPVLTIGNLAVLNRNNNVSSDSLSSIYSRSISGEAPRPVLSSRSSTSTSTATLKQSPLRSRVTLSEDVVLQPRISSESDIDDVAALEARMRRSRMNKTSGQEGIFERREQSRLSSRFSHQPLSIRKGTKRAGRAF